MVEMEVPSLLDEVFEQGLKWLHSDDPSAADKLWEAFQVGTHIVSSQY